jgi:hypothetical protein
LSMAFCLNRGLTRISRITRIFLNPTHYCHSGGNYLAGRQMVSS